MRSVLEFSSFALEDMKDEVVSEVLEMLRDRWGERYIRDEYELSDRLCEVYVVVNHRLRASGGRYVEKWGAEDNELADVRIELHPELKGEENIKDVLRHEVLHMITGFRDIDIFKMLCEELNIIISHDFNFSTIEDYKYKIYCEEEDIVIAKRKRKSKLIKNIERYHCTRCGSGLRVEEIGKREEVK